MGTAPRAIHRIGHGLPPVLLSYGIAVLALGGALLTQWLLGPLLQRPDPFLLFLGAVLVSAWYGGSGPGLAATALSVLLGNLTPIAAGLPSDLLQSAIFVAEAVAICLFSASRSRAIRAQHDHARQQSDAWLADLLQPLGEGVLIFDGEGRVSHATAAAARLLGGPDGQVAGRSYHDLDAQLTGADGQPLPHEQLPFQHALRSGAPLASRTYAIGQGAERVLLTISAAPLRNPDGTPAGAVVSLRDAAQLPAMAVEREHFLAGASALLAASLDFTTTLQNLVRLTVPTLADFCTIHSAEGEELRLLTAAHSDPAGEALLRTINERYPMRLDDYLSMPEVIASGSPLMMTKGSEPHWRLQPRDEQHRALLRELRIGSFMMLPLLVRGVTWGALTLLRSTDSQPYRQADLELAQELARRAAVALDNARLYRETQDAVRARDQFLSIASHELKTPLTSLMGYAELLQRRTAREGTLQERDARALAVVVEQSMRLNRLIGALLDLSRIQSGQLSIERQPVDLAALAGRLVESMQPSLEQHVFQLEGGEAPLLIEGDELRLEQVVQNLLQNAVKYSPAGGQIEVRLSRHEGLARLAVRDQGIGIPKDALPRLFQRFYRANNVDPQQISGMGIGLFVVREIISLHGGSVQVVSQEGQGSTFMIDLPLLRV